MLISQFTLHAKTKKGNRPSYVKAARPELALYLYNEFRDSCKKCGGSGCEKCNDQGTVDWIKNVTKG